ncbi:helix-turn-helix domain-containing protein [Melittangium boletus]|uniref:Helix-turn-helix domain-containing protein n=1 Tax=Melittangium boletus DSM 14713 TaxID=1294270 RepID=A0A250ILP1_9BACT|nr:helix-turn-helix domain-containing protein [Melittangium boletus]ATB32674.1 hypothetical protein MEBOL_006163 [Melittangium boletus DSM 14713]
MTAPTEGTPPAPEWLPVPEAAAAAGVPVRSLYRWIEKKRVPTRQERGTTVVDVAAVCAYAARRAALKASGARAGIADTSAVTAPTVRPVGTGDAGSDRARGIERTGASGTPPTVTRPALTTSGNATPATSDAELAAEVFTRFEEGDTPVDVVREMRIPPERVRALHREWTELRAMGGGGGPSITDRLAELESRLKELTETLPFEVMSVEVNANNAIGRLEGRLEVLERRVAGSSVPPPGFNFGPRR